MSLHGRTGLKLEDTIRKVDNRSAWRTMTAKGKARQSRFRRNGNDVDCTVGLVTVRVTDFFNRSAWCRIKRLSSWIVLYAMHNEFIILLLFSVVVFVFF